MHAFLIMLLMKQALTTVYYSYLKRNYTDAVSLCENDGGQLLRYGNRFLTAIHTCENSTGHVLFWTGHPHYTTIGCTNDTPDKRSKYLLNNHFANCADFCADDVYTHIGITTETCTCYYKKPNIKLCVTSGQCPGNNLERCGQDTRFMVYRKEKNTTCRYRSYADVSTNGVDGTLPENVCGYYTSNFFCKVGSSDYIVCDWPIGSTVRTNMLTTSVEILSSLKTTDANVNRNRSLSTNRTSLENGKNTFKVIWVVAIILVLAFASVIFAVFLYKKKCSAANNALYTTAEVRLDEHCYESPNLQQSNQFSNTQYTVAYENVNKRTLTKEEDRTYIEIN